MKETNNNPLQSTFQMHLSLRCLAKTRAGNPCQSPAMPNGKCRMHGGTSSGAPKGNKNALKHGRYSAAHKEEMQYFRELIRESRRISEAVQ